MAPFLSGGEMIRSVSLEEATCNVLPYKFEAGTPPIAEAIALGAAIDYLESLGLEAIREHEASLAIYGLKQLQSIPDLILYGEKDPHKRIPLFTFNLSDGNGGIIHPHDIETFIAAEGFAIRSGHHCAKPLMRFLGVPATCRVSCAFYNFPEEIQALAATLERARLFFMRR
jgi:cysteine desulfurase/selenocysteine lyase